jgi:hypothetical protein
MNNRKKKFKHKYTSFGATSIFTVALGVAIVTQRV